MTILDLDRKVCHTEAIEDACGVSLVNVCHSEPRLLDVSNNCICTEELGGVVCEDILPAYCADDCLCC